MKSTKILSIAALSLIGMTACSDKDDKTPESGSEVRFNVTVPAAGRLTTTQNIDQFSLWSYTGNKPYMSGVQARRSESSWSTMPTMYWPADGKAVDFYCISPAVSSDLENKSGRFDIEGFTNADGRTDLLYAVTLGASSNPVKINFRHALSKVAFNFKRREASSAQAPLKVDVSEVTLTSIMSTGSFNYPQSTTFANREDQGSWSELNDARDISVYSGGTTTLTDALANLNSSGYEFALPQTLALSKADNTGAYVKVLCSISDEKSGVRIWPKGQEQDYLYFPLNSEAQAITREWEAGRSYVYNITIGVPDSSSMIEFDITVDEYKDFNNIEL